MASDGQIVFEVTADGKHAIADIKAITAAIEKETKNWDSAAKQSANSISDSFSGMLKKLVAGFSAVKIGKALLDLGKDALQAASDLQEVQNVVDVTFGDNANQIEKWAKNAADQFGLTETQAKRFTSTMGAMLKSSGLAGDEIVNMSTDLAGLAADMASFYNLDFDTAFQKIRSGISGETEPLKQLGINMSVANLNAFALQQGLEKTFDQMDQGEQTMLRYQYMMSVTSDAQGDFARTSDGYANSLRRAESAVEGIKAQLGAFLIGPAADALGWVNEFLGSLTAEPERTVLDDFNEIDLQTQQKLQEIESIKTQATETAALLEQLYGNTEDDEQGKQAAEIVSKYGVKSEEVSKYLEELGYSEEDVAEKGEEWLEVCRRLVNTIPGLNSIINTETGEINGGKSAIDEYVNAWAEGQKKIALLKAQEERKNALELKYAELPGLEVDVMLAKNRLEKAHKQLQDYADKFKVDLDWYNGDLTLFDEGAIRKFGLTNEQYELLKSEVDYYLALKQNADDAQAAFDKQNNAYQEGLKILEEGEKVIEETYGSIEEADTATNEWSQDLKDAGKSAVESAKTALTALADYAEGVRESVEKSVESVVKGFEQIKRPTQELTEQRSKLIEEQNALDKTAKDYQQKWDAIQDKIDDVNEKIEKFEPKGMKDALTSQLAFMQEYMVNLEKARQMGLSNELLASLSDGSTESAEYLMQLVADPTAAKEIDALYKQVQERKKEFTDELTQQQLTADQVYQNMAEEAKKAVAELDLGEQAKEYAGKTVAEMAQGISDNVDGVKTAVDAVVEQLNRLEGWNISIDFGTFGEISFGVSAEQIHPHETGLDRVPFDGYLASLHEGESILTAEEARVWNRFKNGGVGTDYETMGSVMRDNIKAGGNVYLDGRVVGSVISDQQGKSYRQLQRSGWQG